MNWFARISIIIILFIFGGSALFMGYAENGLPWKHAEMKRDMTTYLEKRYLDEFELGKVRFDLMHGKNYYTYATSATTGVNFYVERSSDGTFDDGYGYEHWSSYGESLIKPYIPAASTISTNVTFYEPLPKDKDVLDHLQHTCWDVYLDIPQVLTQTNKENELINLLKTIQQMDRDGICFEYMLVGYRGDYIELHKEELQNIREMEKLEIVDYDVWAHN